MSLARPKRNRLYAVGENNQPDQQIIENKAPVKKQKKVKKKAPREQFDDEVFDDQKAAM